MPEDKLVRNSLAVSGASGVAAVVGLVSTALILLTYGLSTDADAYYAAIFLPRLVTTVFRASVPAVLIPAISRARSGGAQGGGVRLVNNLLNHGLLIGIALYALLLIAAPVVIKAMVPGFDYETRQVCTNLFRAAAIGIALAFACEVVTAYLNSRGVFGSPAGAEGIRSGCIMVFVLLRSGSWGIYAVAAGFFVGYLLQFLFLRALAYGRGLRFSLVLDRRSDEFRNVVRDLRYPTVTHGLRWSAGVVERFLASLLGAGALSALSLAQQGTGLLYTITLRSVNVATHPVVSRHAAAGEAERLNATLVKGVKLCNAIGSALFVLVFVLSSDGLAILAGIKSFSQSNADLLRQLLLILACGTPVNGLISVFLSPHYARGDAKTPSLHIFLALCLHLCLQLVLFQFLGLKGIALAAVLTYWVSATRGLLILPERSKRVTVTLAKSVAGTVIAAAALGVGLYVLRNSFTTPVWALTRVGSIGWFMLLSCATSALLLLLFRTVLVSQYREFFGALAGRARCARDA